MDRLDLHISQHQIPWCCPACKNELQEFDSAYQCGQCNKGYPIRDGIPIFVTRDEFYEGKFTSHWRVHPSERHRVWRHLFSIYERLHLDARSKRFIKRAFSAGPGLILDVGCGGGNEPLSMVGVVYGIDLSYASLQQARTLYHRVGQADITQLPLPDEAFDYVYSADLIEHIPNHTKDIVFQEMSRVLKPGGRMAHMIMTEGQNPLFRFGKKYPLYYQKYFIGFAGHIGLEKASETIARFRSLGLKPLWEEVAWHVIWPPRAFLGAFDNEYKQYSRMIKILVKWNKLIEHFQVFEKLHSCFFGLLSNMLGRLLPTDCATRIEVCYEK